MRTRKVRARAPRFPGDDGAMPNQPAGGSWRARARHEPRSTAAARFRRAFDRAISVSDDDSPTFAPGRTLTAELLGRGDKRGGGGRTSREVGSAPRRFRTPAHGACLHDPSLRVSLARARPLAPAAASRDPPPAAPPPPPPPPPARRADHSALQSLRRLRAQTSIRRRCRGGTTLDFPTREKEDGFFFCVRRAFAREQKNATD